MNHPEYDTVRTADSRPIGPVGHCTYCREPIGNPHMESCVCRQRRIVYRVVMEVVCAVPAGWDTHTCEFHKNESSWCADNFIEHLARPEVGCSCGGDKIQFEFLREATPNDEKCLPRMTSDLLPRPAENESNPTDNEEDE